MEQYFPVAPEKHFLTLLLRMSVVSVRSAENAHIYIHTNIDIKGLTAHFHTTTELEKGRD